MSNPLQTVPYTAFTQSLTLLMGPPRGRLFMSHFANVEANPDVIHDLNVLMSEANTRYFVYIMFRISSGFQDCLIKTHSTLSTPHHTNSAHSTHTKQYSTQHSTHTHSTYIHNTHIRYNTALS